MMGANLALMAACLFTVLNILTAGYSFANDNLVAQRLFDAGRYAEAAEIYTDPAWKGVAFYRSSQWWRAAEAFVRADDADSYFNLGNCYVKLGYYALALEAYQAAQSKRQPFEDAEFNARLMRQLLEEDQEQGAQAALQRKSDEIDRVDSDPDESGNSAGEEQQQSPDRRQSGEQSDGDTDSRGPLPEASSVGDSAEAGSDDTPDDQGSPEGGNVKGTESASDQQRNPSGGSEAKQSTEQAQATGLRSRLETEQATEQWLNQIKHDPLEYLRQRIDFELRRRRAAGESAPQGGSQW